MAFSWETRFWRRRWLRWASDSSGHGGLNRDAHSGQNRAAPGSHSRQNSDRLPAYLENLRVRSRPYPMEAPDAFLAPSVPEPYPGSLAHLLAELARIDLLIRVQVARARRLHEADPEFQGLYVSEQEVDDLLARPA